jgi:hypothetical protein
MKLEPELFEAVRRIVAALVAGRYAAVVANGQGGRVSESEMDARISEYGRTLVPLPDEAMATIDMYPQDGNPDEFAMDVPLWTQEEGRSDLTMLVRVRRQGGSYHVEIDDLLVP